MRLSEKYEYIPLTMTGFSNCRVVGYKTMVLNRYLELFILTFQSLMPVLGMPIGSLNMGGSADAD